MLPQGTQEEWLVVFIIVASLNIIGAVVFCLLGSGQVQPWAEPSIEDNQEADINTSSDKNTLRCLTDQTPPSNNHDVKRTEIGYEKSVFYEILLK